MRWALLPLVLMPCSLFGQVIFSENFDSLQVGDRIAASDPLHWRTWSGATGTNEDAPVTDTLAFSPPNSLAFLQTILTFEGGPEDQVLLLGYHLWGSYVLRWMMYVPEGKGANFELLHGEDVPSAAPAAVVSLSPLSDNSMGCYAAGSLFMGYYPHNVWFPVSMSIDLDARTASLTVNDTLIGSWDFDTMPSGTSAPNILGALRFKGASGWDISIGQYYIDDIVFQEGTVGIHEREVTRSLAMAPNPTAGGTVLSMNVPVANALVDIHDASGRVVLQRPWPQGSNRYALPAGSLAPGTYVVRVQGSTVVYSGKLVVMP